jgi:hypothetical protein
MMRHGQALSAALLFALALASCTPPVAPASTPTPAKATPAAFEPGDATETLTAAAKAYEEGDRPAFLALAEKAAALQPGRPRALYYLAAAYALNRRSDDAVHALERLVRLKAYFDIAAEHDFDSLHAHPGFARAKVDLDALLRTRTSASKVAFRLPEKDFVAEGIARDDATGAIFVSSVHRRKIVRVTEDGAAKDFTDEADGLMAVLGITVDPVRHVLWACTSGVPEMRGFVKADDGKAALVELDLATGRVSKRYPLEGPGPHNCNDLFVDDDGAVLVSDASAGELLVLPKDARALTLLAKGFRSPQGIARIGDALYVADWSRGIARVDRATRLVRWLDAPDDVVLPGTDGLRACGGKLLAIQNGVEPSRVVELTVKGDTVRLSRVLEWNHAELHEPTLGIVVGKALLYVADSQWGSFDRAGKIWPDDRLFAPTVLRLSLE